LSELIGAGAKNGASVIEVIKNGAMGVKEGQHAMLVRKVRERKR
jgi:hypothetical protein